MIVFISYKTDFLSQFEFPQSYFFVINEFRVISEDFGEEFRSKTQIVLLY